MKFIVLELIPQHTHIARVRESDGNYWALRTFYESKIVFDSYAISNRNEFEWWE